MATTPQVVYFGNKKITNFIYQDEQCVVFEEDENKQAPIHFLVVPRKKLAKLSDASEDDEILLGHLLIIAKNIAISKGLHYSGYHVMVDEDHRANMFKSLHVFGRALSHMVWPVGPGSRL